ncbi:MAG: right-handed parallel beta-helix repeat-containing protein [Oscillospiraceae bacterium]
MNPWISELEIKLSKLCIEQPALGDSVSVLNFGASTQEHEKNLVAFQSALTYCKENRINKLVVPAGTYYFPTQPDGDVHLLLDGFTDFTLDCRGAELIFEHAKKYISIVNCQRVKMLGITLDWNWEKAPLSSVGVVLGVNPDGKFFDVRFPTMQNLPEQIDIRIVGPFDSNHYTPGCSGGIEFRPYRNQHIKLTGNQETDAKMLAMVRELSEIITKMEKISENTMRFYSNKPSWTKKHINAGQCYNFRHFEYDTIAVSLMDSQHVSLEKVTIYSCPGSGFVGNGDLSYVHFLGCSILPRPGTTRSISTSVDCLHIANSLGNFIIEDCDFGFAGDDCINIHDSTSMGIELLNSNSLFSLQARRGSVLFEAGNLVELRNPDLSPTGFSSRVISAEYDDVRGGCKLILEDILPDGLSKDTVLFNDRFHSENFIIRNCRFTNNRARGVLIHASNTLVEGNLFENIQGAAIQIETGCESRWSEGKGVRNLMIRKNRIQNCDKNAWQMAVLYMGVYLPMGRTPYPIFQNICIESNTIVNCPRLAMFISSCKAVIVRNNAIINPNQIPLALPCYGSSQSEPPIYDEEYHATIQLLHASDILIDDNIILSTLLQSKTETGIYNMDIRLIQSSE